MKKIITAFFGIAASAAFAGVPIKWTVETSRADIQEIDVYHGESLDLEVQFKTYGQVLVLPTNETAMTYWQTNGMGTAYWRTNNVTVVSSNGVMKSSFVADMDVGAKTLRGFMGIAGNIYRASFVLRFKDAPGYTPTIVEWPFRELDFNLVEVKNAPYYTKAESDATTAELEAKIDAHSEGLNTNAVRDLIAPATNAVMERVEELAETVVSATNATLEIALVRGAQTVADATNAVLAEASARIDAKRDLTNRVWSVEGYGDWTNEDVGTATSSFVIPFTDSQGITRFYWYVMFNGGGMFLVYKDSASGMWDTMEEANAATSGYASDINKWLTRAHTNAADLALTTDLPPLTNGLATAEAVAAWEEYWRGESVRLSVTNYYGNTSGEPPRLRIEESETNAEGVVTGWKTVWDETTRQTNFMTQTETKVAGISNAVMNAAYRQTLNQLGNKAPRAWQDVTSAGEAAPPNTVWHTAATTVLAGGTEYAHVAVGEGTICVLVANGANVYTDGEEGTFRFQDDSGKNYFGFDVKDAYTIGCRTDGIDVTESGGEKMVTLTYDLTSSTNPEIMHCTNLTADAWAEVEATWEENPPTGQMVCYINAGSSPCGFYKATISYPGGSKFVTNMQADLMGGIAASNETLNVVQSVYPVITSTGVVWRVKQ